MSPHSQKYGGELARTPFFPSPPLSSAASDRRGGRPIETIRNSMSSKVQVEPEPGLGMGLRAIKDLGVSEFVGLVLGTSLYPKRQAQELIDKRHTDARHAMVTPTGMVIDAAEPIGVFAANEPNDGKPNLICIGVSLPNPRNDDGEQMVY